MQPHLAVNKLGHCGEGSGQELIGELDVDIGLAFLLIHIDLLEYLLPQEVLEVQLLTAFLHQLGISFV